MRRTRSRRSETYNDDTDALELQAALLLAQLGAVVDQMTALLRTKDDDDDE